MNAGYIVMTSVRCGAWWRTGSLSFNKGVIVMYKHDV